jgi:hypothetical protein
MLASLSDVEKSVEESVISSTTVSVTGDVGNPDYAAELDKHAAQLHKDGKILSE